jgi:hypothetical protein
MEMPLIEGCLWFFFNKVVFICFWMKIQSIIRKWFLSERDRYVPDDITGNFHNLREKYQSLNIKWLLSNTIKTNMKLSLKFGLQHRSQEFFIVPNL